MHVKNAYTHTCTLTKEGSGLSVVVYACNSTQEAEAGGLHSEPSLKKKKKLEAFLCQTILFFLLCSYLYVACSRMRCREEGGVLAEHI